MHFENHTNPVTGATSTGPNGEANMPKQSQSEDDPCVVGMACRVPGASSPSNLWDNIVNKVDLQRKMPADRFKVDAFYHPDGTHKGTVCVPPRSNFRRHAEVPQTNAKYGYFLDQDLGLFDAGFFNISGKEAEAMDPQQRLLLEVVYEALEDGMPSFRSQAALNSS